MTKYSTILMFISSSILLILKLTDLKEINTMTILEIAFYVGIIIYTTYIFLKFRKQTKQETKQVTKINLLNIARLWNRNLN